MGLAIADLLKRLPSAYHREELAGGAELPAEFPVPLAQSSGNWRLAGAIREGFWKDVEADLAKVKQNLHLVDMDDVDFIRLWQDGWLETPPKPDESVPNYKLRVQGALARRVTDSHPDAIIEAVAALIRATPADVTLVENEDSVTGDYRPAYFYISFSQSTLLAAGFTTADFTTVEDEVETIINQLAPTAVLGEVVITGGGMWDAGQWDSATWGA